jgi:hypothetical protein
MKGAQGHRPFCSAPVAGLIAAMLLSVSPASSAGPIRFSGELGGLVTDAAGNPQPGAIVLLFNKQDRLLLRAATDAAGSFAFSELIPDLYSVQVSLASFLPAMKDRIQIRPGMRSLLEINLSRIFSSIQLVSTTPAPGGLMNDNWKWTLRTATSTRPILRLLGTNTPQYPSLDTPQPAWDTIGRQAIFTDSRGLIKISASDGPQISDGQADLGTQFAFATSVYGGNHLAVAGDVGYGSASGNSSAAIRTTYSREFAGGVKPEVSVTMRQFYVPLRAGQSLLGGQAAANSSGDGPVLRTLGVSFADKTELSDSLQAEYGFEMNDVSFFEHLHYLSPWARLNYALSHGKLDLTWTSGNPRPELGMASPDSGRDSNADLQRDLTALSMLPRVSLLDGHAKVQRADNYEIGLTQRFGSREYRLSGYHEHVANTALTIASPENGLFAGDLLPDILSNTALFNLGRFDTFGYATSVTQDLGDNYKITLIYGSLGVLSAHPGAVIGTADDLRHAMETSRREAVTLRASGTVRCIGLRFVASYQWTDRNAAMPGPLVSTQAARPDPGFNILLRQPIPSIPGMKGRIEASAELRNLLAQGYLALAGPGGEQLLLVNNPRSLRGSLAFVF